jgi:transcriptional regulator with XRE-family HTH domain
MDANKLVAQNLLRLRVAAGISQEALAVDAGIDRTYVSRIERGLENCTVAVLQKLATAIGCEIVEFFASPKEQPVQHLKPGRKRK